MKKLFSLLSLIVLALASSVIFISCGDDYKNMYLEVQYAEWSKNADGDRLGEWTTVDIEKGLDFVLSENNKNTQDSYYDLRMRVLVKGTKKDIDFVSVSCTGSSSLQLDVNNVESGQEFVVKVWTTGSANLFFTPSVKSDKKAISFPINLYDELASISQNTEFYPAIVKGGELNLNNLTDLIVYKGVNDWTTNQLGVAYSIEGVENKDGQYEFNDGNGHTGSLDTRSNANILKIGQNFDASSIVLKATSVYSGKTTSKEEISCNVTVKIVDNLGNEKFLVNYASSFDKEFSKNNLTKVATLKLYPNNIGYNSTNLVLSGLFDDSAYSFEQYEDVEFETKILVDGKDVTNRAEAYHGLKISQNTSMELTNGVTLTEKLNQVFTIEATTYLESSTNTLQFVVGVKNLRFTGMKNYNINSSVLVYSIDVIRENLPQTVTINDNPYTDGATFSQYIYSDYGNLNGLSLRVNASTSTQKATDIKITAYTSKNGTNREYSSSVRTINFYSYNGTILGGANNSVILRNLNNSIYAKYADGINPYPSTVYVDFEVLSSPLTFDGKDVSAENKKYITVTMTLNTIGKIVDVSSKTDGGTYDLFGSTPNMLLQAEKGIKTNLDLSSGTGGVLVNYTTAKLKSKNGHIKFSADNINFVSELNCGELTNKILYIKADNKQEDQIILQSDLGQVWTSSNLQFVKTTTISNPTISLTTNNTNLVYLGSKINYEGENTGSADFYAMQFNSSADFYAGYGANGRQYEGITSIAVNALTSKENIINYGVDVFDIQKFDNGYAFNLIAKRADLTSAIKVTVKYYTGRDYSIEERTQTLYLEIASFRPMSNLELVANNKEIYYVNPLITDKATTEITATIDNNATKTISFSDSAINDKVYSATKSGVQSLYYIEVRNEVAQNVHNEIEQTGLIDNSYLNMSTSRYSMTLTKNLDNVSNILIRFKVVSYALNIEKTFDINISITSFIKAQNIDITGTDQYGNVYLSLQYDSKKTASFGAKVSNADATYKNLDYQLYKFDENNNANNYIGERVVSNDVLDVVYNTNLSVFDLRSVGTVGGKFILKIVSLDSYNLTSHDYDLYKYVMITISDGSETNPFYLYDANDIANIKNNMDKHYVVANFISLSEITSSIAGEFTGSINGMMVSYNASTGVAVSYSQSVLEDFEINKKECMSLFECNSGVIKNIVMHNVKFNLNVGEFAENDFANIGALVGENKGKVINSSAIILIEGTININRNAEGTTSAGEYNIGALIGKNSGEVYFYDDANDDLKRYTDYRQMVDLTETLGVKLNSVGSATEINVGGAIGKNSGKVVGNYYDFNQNEVDYLTVKSNIKLQVSSASENFSANYVANVGGFVGCNEGELSQIAVKGKILGAGSNLNVGGIVGNNINLLKNSATFSCSVIGQPFEQNDITQASIENQSVGGAVGFNSGNINSLYVLFISNSVNNTQFGIVKGVDVVGGLVGLMTDGTISMGNVQSFVDEFCLIGEFASNNAIDNVQKSVGGLVGYATDGTISKSYAKLNIATDSGKIFTLANGGSIDNSFYIGKINNVANDITPNSNANTYSLVKNYALLNGDLLVDYYGKLYYNGEEKVYYYYDKTQEKELWTLTMPTIDADTGLIKLENPVEAVDFDMFGAVGWTIDNNWTNDYRKYNSGLPVIMDEENPTLLALAESLIARVDDKIFENNKDKDEETLKVYHSDNGIFFAKGTVENGTFVATESTAIVFLNHKTYNLVSQNNNSGLVSLEVLPNIASSSYRVNVVSGSDIISLMGNFVTFRKTGRVEIEFVSTFNPNAKDRVVIFAVEPIDSFELNNENINNGNLSMFTNSTALVSLLAQFDGKSSGITDDYLYLDYAVFKKAEKFEAGKEYYYENNNKSFEKYGENGTTKIENNATFDAHKGNIYLLENVNVANGELNILPLGSQLSVDNKTFYSFGDIQLKLNEFDGNNKQLKLAVNCYLDLSKFVYTFQDVAVNEETLRDLYNFEYKIASNSIDLTLCQKAQSITSNITDTKVATSQSVQFDIEVVTGFVNKNDTAISNVSFIINNQLLGLDITGKDSAFATIECNTDLAKKYKLSSLWELFNIDVCYVLNNAQTGYIFTYTLELKDEYKAIVNDVEFVFTFYPSTNDTISKQIKLTFEPQSITTLRMENYKSGVATVLTDGSNIVEYTSSEVQSSIIVPGKSGLIKIFVEPTFARVDELYISSSSVTIGGKTYTVKFQQMLFDQSKNHYVSYMGYTSGSDNLQLMKNSYIDTDGNMQYTGVVYVRTVLENAVAIKETFTLTVTAREYERENGAILDKVKTEKVATKMLITQFNPGLYVTSNGLVANVDGQSVYLVEKSSNSYKIFATIKGYEVNQNPQLTMTSLNENNVGNAISYVQSAIVPQTNGDYLVTWDLQLNELSSPVAFSVKISLINQDMLLENKEETIIVYPVDYIPTSVSLRGTANNVLRVGVNSQKDLDIVWKSGDIELNSGEITKLLGVYDQQGKLNSNYLQYFYLTSYNNLGQIKEESWKEGIYKSNGNDIYSLGYNSETQKYFVKAVGEALVSVNFGVKYEFVYDETSQKFDIKFYTHNNTEHGGKILNFSFKLDMRVETSEEEPDPIYTVDDLMNMTDGGNYILMNNLTLTDWTPITAEIASLDGNNKILKIKNLQIATNGEIYAGLFATIGEDCIIKNLTIDVSEFTVDMDTDGNYIVMLADENAEITNTYFGFVAGKNDGLIYNSELINTGNSEIKINIKTSSAYAYIGGLVGQNNGNITNSRVGTPYFLELKVNANGIVSEGTTTNTKTITLKSSGILGGLAGVNSGIISSSYFQNANLVNYSTVANDNSNKTGGFVAVNNGSIYNSYTKGKGRNSTSPRGSETSVSATHAGSVAGFVFENSGVIENCYSNIYVQSSSSAVAGFVYRNITSGKIYRSYSAGKVSSGNSNNALATELPFVGVGIEGTEVNKLLSYGELNNCFYLELTGDNFDDNFEYDENMDLPIGLDDTNFADSENLLNYAFVEGNYEQATKGVWTYYSNLDSRDITTSNLGKTFLPELTSANQISRSIRYLIPSKDDNTRNQYGYGSSYELGSKNNPYIIRNYKEYNSVFSVSSLTKGNVIAGSIRLVNNINFVIDQSSNTTATVNTTNGYDLGDKFNSTLTVFDGNGMTISGVDIKNYETQELSSLGLFSNIYNVVVKSLNVEYVAMDYTSTQATYSGGLAGTITDSSIIDVNISGTNTTITARNFGGGVAGIVTGKSMLYNVSSNMNVKVTYASLTESQQYVSKTDFEKMYAKLGYTSPNDYDIFVKYLSYAGGIAGVIDVETAKNNITNVNKLVVGEKGTTTVTADIAGFVAGYLGRSVSATRLKSYMSGSSYVYGSYIAGGLIGENYASISYSQVSALQSTQESVDTAFANYIMNEKNTPTSTPIGENSRFGNLHFVRGESNVNNIGNVAGGFVGVNYNASIHNSYSKASIDANSKYIGGFVGVSVGGGYESCYSQNYFDISNKEHQEYIGGFVGYNRRLTTDGITKVASSIIANDACKVDNIVVSSFYDKSQLKEYDDNNMTTHLDYVIAISDNTISSAQGSGAKSIYTFYLSYAEMSEGSYYKKLIKKDTKDGYNENFDLDADYKFINKLYDLTYEKQLETFTSLFTNFNAELWKKDHRIYTPYLLENPSLNYYQIRTETDLNLIRLHPNGNFELTGNINLANSYKDYVLDIDFTGTLRGKLNASGETPSITGIKINTNNEVSAGFFRKTTGAKISNLQFVYDYMYLEHKKDYVGLLSADENGSEIVGVNLSVSNADVYNNAKNRVENVANISTANVTVTQFGGLFGNSKSTTCTSTNVNLGDKISLSSSINESSFGGLAGSASGESSYNVDSMFMNCQVSMTAVEDGLKLKNFKYVGGAIGLAKNVNVNTVVVGKDDKPIKFVNTDNFYVGGIFGYQHNSYISNSTAKIELMDKNNNVADSYRNIKFGGISGFVKNDNLDKDADILNSSAKLILTPEKANGDIVNNKNILSIGGLVGATNSILKLKDVVAWTTGSVAENTIYFGGLVGELDNTLVVINNAHSYNGGDNYENGAFAENETGVLLKANNITTGGLLGWIGNNETIVVINNSLANGAVFANSKDNSKSKMLHLGGLIGSWYKQDNNGKDILTKVENSVTLPNGDVYSSHITDVYTTFALEHSQFKLNDGTSLKLVNNNWSTDYCVGGIIGRLSQENGKVKVFDNGRLNVNNLIYSSDYVLALEEKEIFSSMPVNVTAQVLLQDKAKEKYFTTENGWTINGFVLPYRTSLSSKMEVLKDSKTLLGKFGNSSSGSAVNPIVINPDENNNYTFNASSSYKYYFVNSGVTSYIDSTMKVNSTVNPLNLFGELNGFVLGNGMTIKVDTTESNNNMTLKESAVVSNLNVQLNKINKMSNTGSHGVIADTNNGTIFNCQVDLYYNNSEGTNANVYGGAIVGENKGNILYCYSTGTIENAGQINYGGITKTNNGFIYSCGSIGLVTGSVTGSGVAGIVCDNQGTIYNSFSAMSCSVLGGELPSTIFNVNSGYIENCYYDQFANNETVDIKNGDNKLMVTHLSTKAMQTQYANKLVGNWCNFMMCYSDKNDNGEIVGETKSNYFNYGYPIYKIEQFWYDDSDAQVKGHIVTDADKIFKKGIFTGNGTKENPYLLINAGTLESINAFSSTSGVYFKLINDITFTPDDKDSALRNWNGIGGTASSSASYFKNDKTGAFQGNFTTGDRFETDWIREGMLQNNQIMRTITNLNGNPLFGIIGSGVDSENYSSVSNIKFANEMGETHVSVLTNSIQGINIDINNIQFEGNYTLSGDNVGLIAGEISVNDSETGSTGYGVKISNIFTFDNLTMTSKTESVFGIIVGKQKGNIVYYNNIKITGGEYGCKNGDTNIQTAGGVVGELAENGSFELTESSISGITLGAKINIGSVVGVVENGTVLINSKGIGKTVNKLAMFGNGGNMGGYIGVLKNGTLNIESDSGNNFELGTSIENKDRVAGNTGGIIGTLNNGTVTGNGKTKINVQTIRAFSNAGGLVGLMNKGVISGFEITFGSDQNNDNYAPCFGGLVGTLQEGSVGENTENDASGKITLKSDGFQMFNTTQLGGLAGVVNQGEFVNIVMEIKSITVKKSQTIKLNTTDDTGMGGLVGVVEVASVADGEQAKASSITLGGITSESDMIISTDETVSNVGGLFGLLKTNLLKTLESNDASQTSNKTELNIKSVNVSGVKNVGGFVGQYAFDDVLKIGKELEKFVGEVGNNSGSSNEGYATVTLPSKSTVETLNVTNGAGNIGGLFGYYNSNASMGYLLFAESETTPTEEDQQLNAFVNNNKVLNYENENVDNMFDEFTINCTYGYHKIENIGGVAGFTKSAQITGKNKASIGYISNKKLSELTMEDFNGKDFGRTLRAHNVGGVVGNYLPYDSSITSFEIVDVTNSGDVYGFENVGGIIGSLVVDQNIKAEFNGSIKSEGDKNIIGVTNVGGIIGQSIAQYDLKHKNKVGDDGVETNVEVMANVEGRNNVGGVVGVVKNAGNSEVYIGDIKDSATVNGLINVGGIVGAVENTTLTLQNTTVKNVTENQRQIAQYQIKVTGNTNVGGFVGNAFEKEKILYITNFSADMIKSIEINAHEYEYGEVDSQYVKDKKEKVYYMPTSIGGLVGYSNNVNIVDVDVKGKITTDGKEVSKQASSVANFMVATGTNVDSFVYKDEKKVFDDQKSFDNATTGIGGMIGTLSGYTTDEYGEIFVDLRNINSQFNVLVDNGINVGGVIGYFAYQANILDNINTISVGDDDDTTSVYIYGAMGVGGMFGRIANFTNAPITAYASNGTGLMKTLEVNFGYVNVQTKPETIDGMIQAGEAVHGEYVGTFAGVSDSIREIKVTGNIQLNNEKGGYYGGIVGKLNGSLGQMATNAGETDVAGSLVDIEDVFKSKTIFNYGGLVGLADATKSDIVVLGSHKYEFTVDSLRTGASTGDVKTHIDHSNKQILLMANKTAKYDAIITETQKYNGTEENLSNPILTIDEGKSTGWSLEYTMFRTMELCEEGSVNGQTVFTTIYDAANITEVVLDSNNKIIYTIYENEGTPILYSRLGIATYFKKEDSLVGEAGDSEAVRINKTLFMNQYGYDKASYETIMGDIGGCLIHTLSANDLNKNLKQIADENIFFNFRSENAFKNIMASDITNKSELLKQLQLDYYYIQGTDNGIYSSTYFKFGLIFANSDNSDYKLKDNTSYGEVTSGWDKNLDNPDRTFSLFDIQAQLNNQVTKVKDETTTWETVKEILNIVGVTLLIAVVVASVIISGGVTLTVGSAIILSLATVIAGFAAVNLIHAIAGLFVAQYRQKYLAINYLTTDYAGVYGYLTTPIAQPWYFENGQLVCESDELLLMPIDVNTGSITTTSGDNIRNVMFVYSSTSRPASYGQIITIDTTNMQGANSFDLGGQTKTEIKVGDKVPKFVYHNGKYYISIFGVDISKRYIVNQSANPVSWDASRNWWTQDNDGLYYVAASIKDNNIGEQFGINTYNIKSSKTIDKTISFGKVSEFVNDGTYLENYDYIKETFSNSDTFDILCNSAVWETKKYTVDTSKPYITVYLPTAYEYLEGTPIPYYDTNYYLNKDEAKKRAKVFAEENNYFDSDAEAFYIQYVGPNTSEGHTISNWNIVDKGNDNSKLLDRLRNKDQEVYLMSSNSGVEKQVKYYYYDTGLKNGYYVFEDGKTYPLVKVDDGDDPILYNGNKEPIHLKDIKRQGDLEQYYLSIESINDINYRADKYYFIEVIQGSEEKTYNYYYYDTSYICENLGDESNPIYVMAKLGIIDKNANYLENKFKFKFNGGTTIYTRYKFSSGSNQFVEELKKNGLLPSSSQNGWVTDQTQNDVSVDGSDYYFTEIVLFSGNRYNSTDSSGSRYLRSYSSAKTSSKYKV